MPLGRANVVMAMVHRDDGDAELVGLAGRSRLLSHELVRIRAIEMARLLPVRSGELIEKRGNQI